MRGFNQHYNQIKQSDLGRSGLNQDADSRSSSSFICHSYQSVKEPPKLKWIQMHDDLDDV